MLIFSVLHCVRQVWQTSHVVWQTMPMTRFVQFWHLIGFDFSLISFCSLACDSHELLACFESIRTIRQLIPRNARMPSFVERPIRVSAGDYAFSIGSIFSIFDPIYTPQLIFRRLTVSFDVCRRKIIGNVSSETRSSPETSLIVVDRTQYNGITFKLIQFDKHLR